MALGDIYWTFMLEFNLLRVGIWRYGISTRKETGYYLSRHFPDSLQIHGNRSQIARPV